MHRWIWEFDISGSCLWLELGFRHEFVDGLISVCAQWRIDQSFFNLNI